MPDFQAWLKLAKLFLLVPSSWWRWRRRWWWIMVITFGSDHIIFALYLSRIRGGTREKEHIQNNGHQGQKNFFHFYEILNWTKRWPSGIFRSVFAFQPPVSFGVLLCYFWKVETVSDPLGYFPMDLKQAALQHPIKMNFLEKLCQQHIAESIFWDKVNWSVHLHCRQRLDLY